MPDAPSTHLIDRLQTHTLRAAPWGLLAARVMAAALQAVEPGTAITRNLQRQGHTLAVGEQEYDLRLFKRIFVIGAGKAGAPMAEKTASILGKHLTQGIVIVKDGYSLPTQAERSGKMQILTASHPLPDQRGLLGAQQIMELLKLANSEDLVIVLLSGGGSALLTSPPASIPLDDLNRLTHLLLGCGATINEINCLRKHLETLKGGGVARLASPAHVITLVLSDVIDNPLDVIASGPTVADPTTYQEAWQVLERYHLLPHTPDSIQMHLRSGLRVELPETPKPGDPIFDQVYNLVIGSNLQAAQAAATCAQHEGFNTQLVTTSLQGEARRAGNYLGLLARQVHSLGQPVARPACLIAGGETTVTVTGDGMGGRNQEVALGAVGELAGLPELALVTLATDGGDGPTDAAGAVVTGQTLQRARQAGMQPDDYLNRNDAYHFFEPLGDLLKPGPTFTNVNDLNFIFAF